MTLVIYDILKSVNKNLSLFAASLNCVGLVFEVLRWNPLGVDMAMVLHGFYQGFPFCFSGGSRIYPECRVRNLFRIRFNGKAPFLPRRSSAQAQKP
jgi:hypothetical protein